MFKRFADSPIKSRFIFGVALITCAISLAPVAAECASARPGAPGFNDDDLSPAELRYLAIETELALQSDWRVGEYDLKIETRKGSLILNGEVPDETTRAAADQVARRASRGYTIEIVNKIRLAKSEASGTAEATKQSTPTPLDQEQIEKVRELMETEFPGLAKLISVNFELQPMPQIVLEGLIPSYEQKLEVSQLMRREFRSLPVVNNLQVRRDRAGERIAYTVSPKERTMIVERDDTEDPTTRKRQLPTDPELEERLASVLKNDPVTREFKIQITVEDGVAWLSGNVASANQKVRAIRLAEEQPGVRYVVDQLRVIPGGERATVDMRVTDQKDVIFYLRRYLKTRMPALLNAAVEVTEHTIRIIPQTEKPMTPAEISTIEGRLKRIPELKGYTFEVKPKLTISNPGG
jgi:osmotically-inducible protein OsmY